MTLNNDNCIRLVREVLPEEHNDSFHRFAADLPLLHYRALRLGLHETGHAIHEAVRKLGYELAALEEK